MAENIVRFNHVNSDKLAMAIELIGEEKIEEISEYEIKEYLGHQRAPYVLNQVNNQIEMGVIFYQDPLLSKPEVPPELFCRTGKI